LNVLTCVGGKCTPFARIGRACDEYPGIDCVPEARCVGGVCVARPPPGDEGATCVDALDCIDFECRDHRCAKLRREGESCGGERGTCETSFMCVEGTCELRDGAACE
jgi:hypothetical protein